MNKWMIWGVPLFLETPKCWKISSIWSFGSLKLGAGHVGSSGADVNIGFYLMDELVILVVIDVGIFFEI